MTRVYIALGSNLGNREENLRVALALLAARPGVTLRATADVRETAPEGGVPQGKYLNTVCEVETSLTPPELLDVCQQIERELGRDRSAEPVRWGPRLIDLDLLLYGSEIVHLPDLEIPHPRLHLRRFVLEPLAELSPEAPHPGLQRTAAELLAELAKKEAFAASCRT